MKFLSVLNQLEGYYSEYEQSNIQISDVSVGWHIEHSLLVANSIIKMLVRSEPSNYSKGINFKKSLFFILKYIPRKKAKAPSAVQPDASSISPESLSTLFIKVRERFSQLDNLPKTAHFKHAYLGTLNKEESCRFMLLHTQHHIKIIKDILR